MKHFECKPNKNIPGKFFIRFQETPIIFCDSYLKCTYGNIKNMKGRIFARLVFVNQVKLGDFEDIFFSGTCELAKSCGVLWMYKTLRVFFAI